MGDSGEIGAMQLSARLRSVSPPVDFNNPCRLFQLLMSLRWIFALR